MVGSPDTIVAVDGGDVADSSVDARRRWPARLVEQVTALVRDPFFFLTCGLLLAKSVLAVCLINNPDHSVFDPSHWYDYETSTTIFVAFVVMAAGGGLALRGRARLAYYVALDGLASLLLVADIWYFRAYTTFLSFVLWQQTTNLHRLWSSVHSMSRPVDLLFVADLAVLVPLVLLWRTLYRSARRAAALAVLMFVGSVGALWLEHHRLDVIGNGTDQRFLEPCWEARQTISYQSPLGFHVMDLLAALFEDRTVALTTEQRGAIASWFAAKRETLPDNRYKGLLRGKNLIVVQVESLENFVIGRRVDGQEITPTLNALLPNSLYFTSIYDQANEGMSSDSDLMTNTSVYPVRKGSTFFHYADNAYNSLPRILRADGYRATIAMHPDPGAYWNWKNALTALGFDACLDQTAFVNHEILGLGLADSDFLPQVAELLRRQPEPFYAYLVTLTSHEPFELPARYRELELDDEFGDTVLGRSFQCFRYTDRAIGSLLERLRGGGLLDRSVVVIYGDHASVHRFFNDEVAQIDDAEDWMRDPRAIVPLIVYSPGLTGERFAVTGGHIDIMPTLLYLLGVDERLTADTAMGRNLLKTRLDFAVLPSGRVVGAAAGTALAARAVRGLAMADLILRGDYFRALGYGR